MSKVAPSFKSNFTVEIGHVLPHCHPKLEAPNWADQTQEAFWEGKSLCFFFDGKRTALKPGVGMCLISFFLQK
jgi:hypothetical protein